MLEQMYGVDKLKKVAVGNFLWMMGLVLCGQAFLQAKDNGFTGVLTGFDWWIDMQLWTSLNPAEFSFFAAAIAFAMSSMAHFLYLNAYMFNLAKSKEKKAGKSNE